MWSVLARYTVTSLAHTTEGVCFLCVFPFPSHLLQRGMLWSTSQILKGSKQKPTINPLCSPADNLDTIHLYWRLARIRPLKKGNIYCVLCDSRAAWPTISWHAVWLRSFFAEQSRFQHVFMSVLTVSCKSTIWLFFKQIKCP